MATKIAAPVVEKGYVNTYPGWLNGWNLSGDQFEQVPELLWPNSVRIYTRMCREDARIASVLRAVGLPIRRTQWRIDQNGASDEVTEFVATDLGLPIVGEDTDKPTPRTKGRFSWAKHLQQALLFQQFGHSVFETTYRIENGCAHLNRVSPRPPGTIAFWNVARNGDLISVQQWPAGTFFTGAQQGLFVMAPPQASTAIPAERLAVYVRDPDPGVWMGNSLLRPAYKHWVLKDELMRIEAAAARRNGIGVPGFTASEAESEDPQRLTQYKDAASAYRGGESAGFSIPYGAEFKLYGVEGNLPDLRMAIEYHDKAMGMVALAHFLNLDGKGGSYALASTLEDTFTQSVQTVAIDMRDVAQQHIVEDLVDVNWGPDEPAPRLTFDEIGSRQDAAAAALNLLVMAGLLTPDPRLEAYIRQSSGLPGPDPDAPPPVDPTTQVTENVKVAAHSRRLPRARVSTAKTKGHPTLW